MARLMREEIVLALDAFFRVGDGKITDQNSEIIRLSDTLRSLDLHPIEVRSDESFRPPDGVDKRVRMFRWYEEGREVPSLYPEVYEQYRDDRAALDAEVARISGAHRTDQERGSRHNRTDLVDDAAAALARGRAILDTTSSGDLSTDVGSKEPEKVSVETTRYRRDPRVVAYVLAQADGCELCGGDAPFETKEGRPYLEVHHVEFLSQGGSDTVSNAVAVCPNCHAECHHGARVGDIPDELRAKVSRLRSEDL